MKRLTIEAVRKYVPEAREATLDDLADELYSPRVKRGTFEWYRRDIRLREIQRRCRIINRSWERSYRTEYEWVVESDRITVSINGNEHMGEAMLKAMNRTSLGPFTLRRVEE